MGFEIKNLGVKYVNLTNVTNKTRDCKFIYSLLF